MKSIVCGIVMLCSVIGFAQDKQMKSTEAKATTLHGYVVDQMCAKSMAKKSNPMERAAKHNRDCALEEACAASGYGMFYDNAKWVKFDENGDKLAKSMFEKSKKDKDFLADVSGEMKGDKFAVTSLSVAKSPADESKKVIKKDEVHEDHK